MRFAFILTPALVLTAAAFAPGASAKTCSKICNNPAAHYQAATPRPIYKAADHSHVRIYNGVQHNLSAGRAHKGVRILTPAPLYNNRQQANFAAMARRAEADAAALELARTQARLATAQQAEASARLSAIEAKQDLILERQKANTRPRRRIYYGNPRFFGRNGFIGNRNFAGASVPSNRKIRRKKSRGY